MEVDRQPVEQQDTVFADFISFLLKQDVLQTFGTPNIFFGEKRKIVSWGLQTTFEVDRINPDIAGKQTQEVLDRYIISRLEILAFPVSYASDAQNTQITQDSENISPFALGSLPFSRKNQGLLHVPKYICIQEGNQMFVCICKNEHQERDERDNEFVSAVQQSIPSFISWYQTKSEQIYPLPPNTDVQELLEKKYVLSPESTIDKWKSSLDTLLAEMEKTHTDKTVLARKISLFPKEDAIELPEITMIWSMLQKNFPNCFSFVIDGLVGASPELLIARNGSEVFARPLAGTIQRTSTKDQVQMLELRESMKDQTEHRITVSAIHESLLPWCSFLDEHAEPNILTVGNIHHLATELSGELTEPYPSVISLVTAIHPTPALCGFPRDNADKLIEKFENFDRHGYGGPIGWIDQEGNGEWAVAIRCAEVTTTHIDMFAGVGIVPQSESQKELLETEAKFQPIKVAIASC